MEELYCLITPLFKFDIILDISWIELHDPYILFKQRIYYFYSNYYLTEYLKYRRPVTITSPSIPPCETKPSNRYRDIAKISTYAFTSIAKRRENQIISLWPEDFKQLEQPEYSDELQRIRQPGLTINIAALNPKDYKKFFQKIRKTPISRDELIKKVPLVYYRQIDVQNLVEVNKLPPHRAIDYFIRL